MRGLGRAKACQLQAGFELALRLLPSRSADRLQVLEPADLAPQLILELGRLDHEVLRVVLLDAKLRVVRDVDLYRGTVHGSAVRTGELFKDGVRHNASAIVLAHNHPSGDPTPSLEDVHATREAVEAGKLLDIEVLDHLVVGERSYLSMRTLGLGFAG